MNIHSVHSPAFPDYKFRRPPLKRLSPQVSPQAPAKKSRLSSPKCSTSDKPGILICLLSLFSAAAICVKNANIFVCSVFTFSAFISVESCASDKFFVPCSQETDSSTVINVGGADEVSSIPETQNIPPADNGEQRDILAATECEDINSLVDIMSEVLSTQDFTDSSPVGQATSTKISSRRVTQGYSTQNAKDIRGSICYLRRNVVRKVFTKQKQNAKNLLLSANKFKGNEDGFEVFKLCDAKKQCSSLINFMVRFVPVLRTAVNKGRNSTEMYFLRDKLRESLLEMSETVSSHVSSSASLK